MITINGLHRQLVYDVERYNDTMNNDNDGNPVIGPRDWKQQKLRRGFKQNSSICATVTMRFIKGVQYGVYNTSDMYMTVYN